LYPSSSFHHTIRLCTRAWHGAVNLFTRHSRQLYRSSCVNASGQTSCSSAAHFTSATCLAHTVRDMRSPPAAFDTVHFPSFPDRLEASGARGETPGIVRPNSGTVGAIRSRACADCNSSQDGKCVHTTLQTSPNSTANVRAASDFPDDPCSRNFFITAENKTKWHENH